ncbi:cutinase family protein [Skermania piniformis]|uniref:Cutinase family protein n=1 Tax=Skermania pinensis TaxID=39122 RepID=A0ABX8S3D1_9ACTN|nr:cutinase family protein [Skermania piniformis]QXQ12324.1 cutinase family protein [Skermania piniformis]
MIIGRLARIVGVAIAAGAVPLLPAAAVPAAAGPCPDIEVVFARGTAEPPGPGINGAVFVEALRARAVGRSVESYGVNYAASANFGDPMEIARTAVDGIRDTQRRIESVVAGCPGTKIVLAGYSQGAVVTGFATMDRMPTEVPSQYAQYVPPPMPAAMADHVSAVVLFGKPSDRWMRDAGAPAVTIGERYRSKTVEYCMPGDTICDGAGVGQPNVLHSVYAVNGMVFQGADFAADRSR